jgi:hypothetical protein
VSILKPRKEALSTVEVTAFDDPPALPAALFAYRPSGLCKRIQLYFH